MANMTPRAGKLSALIQRIVAESLQREMHDPRLRSVTITDVRVTNDLQLARIYWTELGEPGKEEGQRKRAAQALNQAKGRLRSRIGHKAGLRLTPQLEFVFDEVPAQAAGIDDILVVAAQRDSELDQLREGKAYAGDADPYRHDDDDEDGENEGGETGSLDFESAADSSAAPADAE